MSALSPAPSPPPGNGTLPPSPPPLNNTPVAAAPPPSNATVQPPSATLAPPPPPPSAPSPTSPSPPSSNTPFGLFSPPPPTSVNRSPPPPPANSPPPPISTESESSSSTFSTAAIAGIALGSLIVVAVFSLVFFCCFKKRKRRSSGNVSYYPPHQPAQPDHTDDHRPNQQHWKHNAPPASSYAVNMMQNRPNPLSRPPHHPSDHPPFLSNSGGSMPTYSSSEATLPPLSPGISMGLSKSTFNYEELELATYGFSDSNLLGQGGFGYVHKGVLPNGKEVAIKQLKAGSGQGEREFQAEIDIISRVHHRHLVSLVGYCIRGSQRLLVYEFVPNKTLEFHLHEKGRPTMDWPTRLKLAKGAAKGLAYLHEDCHPKIIHRDIKAANILVDLKFEAKVADFGLAKFTSDVNTHVSTRVMGTFGYLAPEYAASGKLTEKSDVFSFGVMLLELITGRRPIETVGSSDDSLVDWARPLLCRAADGGGFDEMVDERLHGDYDNGEMTRMASCAAACVRHSARRRPQMSQVVRALEGDVSLSALNEGVKPGHSAGFSPYGSSDYDADQYKEDMEKFRKVALVSQGYTSSDYSESGVFASSSSSSSHPRKQDRDSAPA